MDTHWLGRRPCDQTQQAMRAFTEARTADTPDQLWIVEHDPVFTQGLAGRAEHLLAPGDIPVLPTLRGGQATYHGPGQVVGYPILDLNPDRRDVHRYVRDLEDVMIRVCERHGLEADRIAGRSGAWVMSPQLGPEKIGAIGVRVSRWITSHGFAFNVNTDLSYFGLIVPCGISDRGVTSLEKATGRAHDLPAVEEQLVAAFADVFGARVHPG